MTREWTDTYGPWCITAGGSDGVGVAFAHGVAARGMNVVLVARRLAVLNAAADEIRQKHRVEVRTLVSDLSRADALAELVQATADLEVGRFVYDAGGDDRSAAFLEKELDVHLALVRRNCQSVLEAAYRFGAPMVARGRGAIVLVTSGAAWAGGPTWICGSTNPTGGSPFGALPRRDAVLAMSRGATRERE